MMAGVLAVAFFNVMGNVIAWMLKYLSGAPSGQRLQGPFSPGLAGSVELLPSSRRWIGSNQGAPLWLGENGTRRPRCGRNHGQETFPLRGSKRICCRLAGVVDL